MIVLPSGAVPYVSVGPCRCVPSFSTCVAWHALDHPGGRRLDDRQHLCTRFCAILDRAPQDQLQRGARCFFHQVEVRLHRSFLADAEPFQQQKSRRFRLAFVGLAQRLVHDQAVLDEDARGLHGSLQRRPSRKDGPLGIVGRSADPKEAGGRWVGRIGDLLGTDLSQQSRHGYLRKAHVLLLQLDDGSRGEVLRGHVFFQKAVGKRPEFANGGFGFRHFQCVLDLGQDFSLFLELIGIPPILEGQRVSWGVAEPRPSIQPEPPVFDGPGQLSGLHHLEGVLGHESGGAGPLVAGQYPDLGQDFRRDFGGKVRQQFLFKGWICLQGEVHRGGGLPGVLHPRIEIGGFGDFAGVPSGSFHGQEELGELEPRLGT
mmetsp:Transcript_369/g.2871  ORF Transcript_369/g.2871 Transcript_369/m.2871 type:complete len:372 (-) Transcript_369:399-1514(-)